jgi:3-methyladenine DNA glycosylase/8-oxoguanine DNA glycosylase
MPLALAARPPFSLIPVVNSHGWIQLAPFRLTETGGFSYVARLAQGAVVEFAVEPLPDGVSVETGDRLSDAQQDEIAEIVRWMVGLDQDLSPFYEAARDEPKLAQAAVEAKGRILRSATLFEDVVKTILTTNTLWAATKRMTSALVNLYGDPLPADPARRAFPTPERLAAVGPDPLRADARLGYRAPFVAALAHEVVAGKLDLESLKSVSLTTPELRKRLLAIQGIGPYAAANLLMLLGHYDYIPTDSWALKMVSREFYGSAPVTAADVEQVFAPWGKWKGLAYWFWQWEKP